MDVRPPSVRHPRSFYDVFTVTALSLVIMAIVFRIWHGTFVRLEMVLFMGVAFLWAGWAITEILK